jgi:hypothetical protein
VAFGKTFRDTGSFQKAGTSSMKRVPGRIFTINKLFHRSWKKLNFEFFPEKTVTKKL